MTKNTKEYEIPENINKQLNETLGIVEETVEEYTPTYRVYGEMKIPVSKAESKLWRIRKQQALKVMEDVTTQWDLAYKYFNSDQIILKDDGTFEIKNDIKSRKVTNCSENLVWANNTGLIPALYSQDPSIEVTNNKDKDEVANKTATMVERLINVLFKKRVSPGLNIKNKARKGILNALLTNRGILKIGWTYKIDGTDKILTEIQDLATKLENAQNVKEVKDIEGKIKALEEIVNYNTQEGPYIKHIRPYDLLIDPNALEQDGTDANWIMEREYIPTEYLKAKFGKDNGKNETESVYEEGKILSLGNKESVDANDDEETISLSDTPENNFTNYGYDNSENYKKSCLTECFWIWDKLKRRVYLYSNNNWDYPIWVWEDLYKLEEFFPYYVLNFHENPNASLCKGETSYYLDQQDAINMINNQIQKMREFGFNHYLLDKNSGVEVSDIQKWLNSPSRKVVPINLPPDKKLEDILFPAQIPADKSQTLYDKSDLLRTVDMITGTDAATRSGEYKTNTTNLAIQSYIAGKSLKLDDKRDLIENWIGNVGWGIAQLCLMNMSVEQVGSLIGPDNAQFWKNYTQDEIKSNFSLQVVGGSTVKPTSDAKKQQALQVAQVLGQFAGASPIVTIIMLQVLQRAIDEVVVKEEDFEIIRNTILQQLQAQQMQAQQQAQLAQAQANQANSDADKNVVETAQIMSAQNGVNPDQQTQTPKKLLGRN